MILEYIYGKLFLGVASSLFIGFSFFHADSSIQGLQNVIFSVFLLCSIFTPLVQQVCPRLLLLQELKLIWLDYAKVHYTKRSL